MNGRVDGHFVDSNPGAGGAEETLRIIASLPAPEGLEERVHSGLKNAPRAANVLSWPAGRTNPRRWAYSGMVRGAAAAAIVFVVAGGGWGVYSRVQTPSSPKVVAMPRIATPSGFATGNAIRAPQTLSGPVLTRPITTLPKRVNTPAGTQKRTAKKSEKARSASARPRPMQTP